MIIIYKKKYNKEKFLFKINIKLEIIHNDLHFGNIMIIKNNSESKFRCVIIDYNLAYINKFIYNIGIINRYNLGIKNIFNKSYDLFVFITLIGTICIHNPIEGVEICNNLPDTYNIFTYNLNNYKYLNKIFFKKNEILQDLVIQHILLYFNNIYFRPFYYYNYPYEFCSVLDIINNKYFIKKLKKINYNI